jgi:CDGSH-type Zn-finger protein
MDRLSLVISLPALLVDQKYSLGAIQGCGGEIQAPYLGDPMAIKTIESLREHLQWAIQLEHATIPPYLTALYSLKPGANVEARHILTSVVIEEMLHMTLAANVLNAIGGAPKLDRPDFIPRYPTFLPHSAEAFEVSLEPFSKGAIDTFMQIERPAEADAPDEDDEYDTIGQFYQAIEHGIQHLCEELGEAAVFSGDPGRQITPDQFDYHASGRVIGVYDLQTALAALEEIIDQGEGLAHKEVWDGDRDMFHPEREEVAHYFRFMEIRDGRSFQRGDTPASGPTGPSIDVDWSAVYPMRRNPRTQDMRGGSDVVAKMGEFNLAYCDLMRALERAFNGEREQLSRAIPAMHELSVTARELVSMDSGDGITTAAPSFEYIPRIDMQGAGHAQYHVKVLKDGPYLVTGGLPLTRKRIVYSEHHEPQAWLKYAELEADATYRLCRCGQSKSKPFCDNSHMQVGFDGKETAPTAPSAARARRFEGTKVTMTDDSMLCIHAGFCNNREEGVWDMVAKSAESRVRFTLMHMVEQCPSGKLTTFVDGEVMEPDLPHAVAVVRNGPYWLTGGVRVTMSDGRELEPRNRVTLCRCGRSKNKPLCDGSHVGARFHEG